MKKKGYVLWRKKIDQPIISFQATINLVVAYDPPANAPPNPNDPQGGDATVDAGMFIS